MIAKLGRGLRHGSPDGAGSAATRCSFRKIPSRIANSVIRKFTRAPRFTISGASLRVTYRREVTDELRLYGEMHRFISVLADNMGARIAEVEVNHRPRRAGVSK